jgi:colicin import membrane protein
VSETQGDRSVAMLLSILVHAAVAGLLGFGWWHFRKPVEPVRQLAIEATVVMATEATPAPAPAPAPDTQAAPVPAEQSAAPAVPPEPLAPAPDSAQVEQEKRAVAVKREAAEREAAERERAAQDERERRESEQRQREAEQQAAAQKAQAAVEKAARLKAQQVAQQAAQDKARREAELHAQLASEERINAARGSAAMASYIALITARINRAWIRPPSVRAGLNCELRVTQVPGGEVTAVQIGNCNGDQAARESIEAAVYRASPLPTPSNPDLFDRNLTIRFHPDE